MKNIVIIIVFSLVGILLLEPTYGQAVLQKDTIIIGNKVIHVIVLPNSTKRIVNYEEGTFITYSLADSSYVNITFGTMNQTPEINFDSATISCYKKEMEKEIYFGQRKNSTFYKEVVLKNVAISYDNVKLCKKELFDYIVNSFTINPIALGMQR